MVWGLDGSAQWRKVTITVTVAWSLNNFQNNLTSWSVNCGWGLAARGGARLQLQLQ